jgi:hypothetical protein
MCAARPRALSVALALLATIALSSCGKSARQTETVLGQAKDLAPIAAQGAVSLTTRNTTRLGGASEAADAAAVARAVYPSLTDASRPQAVVLVDEHDLPDALAASVLAAAPLGAPVLYTNGSELPPVTLQTLAALRPLGAKSLEGVQVIRIGSAGKPPASYRTQSLPASDPAGTAAAILALAPSAHHSHEVVVVPLDAPAPMLMPAAGLSAESGAPILFVGRAGVPTPTATALSGMRRPAIYVIDPGDVDAVALAQLRKLGSVTEIGSPSSPAAGERATANSIAVARFTDGTFGWGVKEPGHGLVFANAGRPLDAAAAASLSATGDYGPLLLFEEAGQIPAQLNAYLGDIQPAYTSAPSFRPVRGVYNHGWLIGDEKALSGVAQAELDSLLQISPRKGSEEPSVSSPE